MGAISPSTTHRSPVGLHARIVRCRDAGYQIFDENSTNGVYIFDRQVRKSALTHGDLIRLGDIRFVYIAPNEIFSFDLLRNKPEKRAGSIPFCWVPSD
ncbi:MAG: FHA domain-containing protein [Marinilabiliales bacterium]|nr:FHA domain-containing protein [Marinilabiliales bacterium]